MTNFDTLQANLEKHGIHLSLFATAQEAADYLDAAIDETTVGFGGSVTLRDMGLYERLGAHNTVLWHWMDKEPPLSASIAAPVYLASLNGIAETGELVNIDGAGNRLSATTYGPKKIYFVAGRNKVAPTLAEAIWRARNIAAPKNAQRLGVKTPCAVKGDKCYDCSAPQRICRELLITWRKPTSVERMELVLIDEDLGY